MKLFLTVCSVVLFISGMAQPMDNSADNFATDPSQKDSKQKLSATPKGIATPALSQSKSFKIADRESNNVDVNIIEDSVFYKHTNCRVTTLAGNGIAGNVNDTGHDALLNFPKGVAVDATGNVYVADAANNIIRRITPGGIVTNYAGTGISGNADGKLTKASFYYPCGIAIDAFGNIYIADKGNHKIRKINSAGAVTTLAGSGLRGDKDGAGKDARFDKPVSLAVDDNGNVYVADQCNHKIRKITADGIVTTLAGNGRLGSKDGNGIGASFYDPSGVAVDGKGNVYVADYSNNRIRKITPVGDVTTLTGNDTTGSADGKATAATFYFPDALAVDKVGNIFIADQINNKIRMLTTNGIVYTIAGNGNTGSTDGIGETASFDNPAGVAIDSDGSIYVADYNNHKIRKIKPAEDSPNDNRKAYYKPAQ